MSKNLLDELKPEPVLEVEAAVAVHLAQQRPHPWGIPKPALSATMPRFEMTILWDFSNYTNYGS